MPCLRMASNQGKLSLLSFNICVLSKTMIALWLWERSRCLEESNEFKSDNSGTEGQRGLPLLGSFWRGLNSFRA